MKKRNPFGDGHDDGHGGLIITPLLDLFVALLPFLILSAVMTRINVVDITVSKPVAVLNPKKQDKSFDLLVKLNSKNVQIIVNGKVKHSIDIYGEKDKVWRADLHNYLVKLKKSHPSNFEFKLEPASKVDLEYVMAIMDEAREMKTGDEEIIRIDEATGKKVKVRYLFPKVILRGVYS